MHDTVFVDAYQRKVRRNEHICVFAEKIVISYTFICSLFNTMVIISDNNFTNIVNCDTWNNDKCEGSTNEMFMNFIDKKKFSNLFKCGD